MNLHEIASRLRKNRAAVDSCIAAAAKRSGRQFSDVHMVVVTKLRPLEQVIALVESGQADLGENHPQALWQRAAEMSACPVRWHLIGHMQTNKARRTFPLVRMIHAVDSLKLLRLLDELASHAECPPAVLLQVNCSREPQKQGWPPDSIVAESAEIAACTRIPIAGLMTMAAFDDDKENARPAFVALRTTRDRLSLATGLPLPELSMGMSNDYEVAVEEGATWVRIGSALFEGID